ncbi:hypothetical protein KFE25_001852 [Diacronema lutheri]|uniref:HMG box domain-containing protein n=1 Tax=Diacronema lutheri TaxID=2081491 RepID=A0A8J5XEI7_DIALT|nr:hypothetical protein KFE25_001852 [Diacronema lutheri]
MLQNPGGGVQPNWPMSMPIPQPQWYQVTCPNCGSQLQVQLPEGITSVQCGNCKAVFAVQIQQTPYSQAKPPGPMAVKRGRKKKDKPARPPRSPSAYNLFMKDEVSNVKREHPELRHRDAFKMAAERWADSPRNPQNKGKPGFEGVGVGAPGSAAPLPAITDAGAPKGDELDEEEGEADEDEDEAGDADDGDGAVGGGGDVGGGDVGGGDVGGNGSGGGGDLAVGSCGMHGANEHFGGGEAADAGKGGDVNGDVDAGADADADADADGGAEGEGEGDGEGEGEGEGEYGEGN